MAASSQLLRAEILESFQVLVIDIDQFCIVSRISSFLTITTFIIPVQAAIVCHLDYCISLLSGLSALYLSPCQQSVLYKTMRTIF